MMLDIDRFKVINDTYGHAAGDRVLIAVARAVRAVLRSDDLVGRLEGEEFAVVLARQSPSDALKVAQRLLETVRALDIDLDEGASSRSPSASVPPKSPPIAPASTDCCSPQTALFTRQRMPGAIACGARLPVLDVR